MYLNMKHWGWLLYVTAAILLLQAIPTFYYMVMPMHHWIRYYEVMPVKDEFKVGENLKFDSLIETKKKSRLQFNDILYCRDEKTTKFVRESEQNTENMNVNPYEKKHVIWPYFPPVMRVTECRLNSTIVLVLPFDLDKSIQIVGKSFQIKE